MLSDELRYQLLRTIERNPELTQRQIAKKLGLSLGKVNYCIKALLESGWVVSKRLKMKDSRAGHAYFLTSRGIEEKKSVTVRYLNLKLYEYEEVLRAICEIETELPDNQCLPTEFQDLLSSRKKN